MLLLLSQLLLVGIIPAVQSASSSHCAGLPFPPSDSDIRSFTSTKFDFVIIGGGTAGVALGARLAEDSKLTVGIIEAGRFHQDDPIINIPRFDANGLGNPDYDWNFVSVPQVHAGGRNLTQPRGKLLGGSSGINGMAWCRASAQEYDAWSTFASSSDWSWNGLLPFFKATESVSFNPPNPYPGISKDAEREAEQERSRLVGSSGPVVASNNAFYFDIVPTWVKTLNGLGFPTNPEPESGDNTGVSNMRTSIDRKNGGVRAYSASAYYCNRPVRHNLHILTGAQATKVLFSKQKKNSELVATGVQFSVGSQSHVVNAGREVILSAGTVQTPQLLELSGIGNPTLLHKYGITTLIDLPTVGENLQEHLFVGIQWQLKPGFETFDILRNNLTFATEQMALYNATGTGLYTDLDSATSFLSLKNFTSTARVSALLDLFDSEAKQAPKSSLQALQYPIQRAWIEQGKVAQFETQQWATGLIAPAANTSYMIGISGNLHPTSRGSVHIGSKDPLAPPQIDPNFLANDFDAQVALEAIKFFQKVGKTAPISSVIQVENFPSPDTQTDDDLLDFIRTSGAGGDHLIGTAAMGPRSHGGVVDAKLHVYGTKNLRVVDASIFPLHISAHTQATVYAVAEKAAKMIKDECN